MNSSTSGQMELLHKVLQEYDLENAQVVEIRDKGKKAVWHISSCGRDMVLKKMPSSVSRTRFITDAASHLLGAGVRVPKMVRTKGRQGFVSMGNLAYILMEWLGGKQPDYTRDMEGILSALAAFHRGSVGFTPPSGADCRSHLGTWTDSYEKKKNQLKVYAELVRRRRDKDEFTETFLENFELAVKKIDRAIRLLEASPYEAWVKTAKDRGCLCHQDFTPKNLRMQPDGGITVFDLDSITIDIPARDLRKITNKFLKKGGGGEAKMLKRIVSIYQTNYPLTKGQWEVVAADLLFPHLFYGIIDKYYLNRAPDWSPAKHMQKLRQSIKAENNKEEVISHLLEGI